MGFFLTILIGLFNSTDFSTGKSSSDIFKPGRTPPDPINASTYELE
jgi:hypothetical protein